VRLVTGSAQRESRISSSRCKSPDGPRPKGSVVSSFGDKTAHLSTATNGRSPACFPYDQVDWILRQLGCEHASVPGNNCARRVGSASVQHSSRQLDHYPVALLRDVSAADLLLSVYIKPMGGELRQSVGLIWRVRDRDNYYAALLDARDGRVRLLRMLAGRPHEIASAAAPIEVEFQRQSPSRDRGWYALRVEAVDDYTVRITGLAHADRADALYDPAANVTWSTSFSVDRTGQAAARGGPP
jgi:hypothetical protein